jgi:hypothetical protein
MSREKVNARIPVRQPQPPGLTAAALDRLGRFVEAHVAVIRLIDAALEDWPEMPAGWARYAEHLAVLDRHVADVTALMIVYGVCPTAGAVVADIVACCARAKAALEHRPLYHRDVPAAVRDEVVETRRPLRDLAAVLRLHAEAGGKRPTTDVGSPHAPREGQPPQGGEVDEPRPPGSLPGDGPKLSSAFVWRGLEAKRLSAYQIRLLTALWRRGGVVSVADLISELYGRKPSHNPTDALRKLVERTEKAARKQGLCVLIERDADHYELRALPDKGA